MRADELRSLALFDGLTDQQLTELVEAGAEVRVVPGAELFHEGEHADFWWLLVDGAIDLVRHIGREETVVGRMDAPGRWAGGFRAWDEHGVYLATARGASEGRVLRVPATVLRERASAWFPFGGHLIEGLYRTARTIESTARQRESLVALGTLAAGLAHELNNPAAAATRAVDALEGAYETLVSSLGRLAEAELSAAQFTRLDALRRAVTPPVGALDPLAMSDCEDDLSMWLDAHGVESSWTLAPQLASAGVNVDWCERAAAILEGTDLRAGLDWVASTYSATALLGEVKESTRRISGLVAAVKSYSQMDRASVQQFDVTDGLESTLVMLGGKLGQGIKVVRRYSADDRPIEAYAGELNQVWTNLIGNAIDAMGGEGTLELATKSEGDSVVVEIRDSGPGMPPEVAARAFEAFFTTKEVGKGTGLGLDIAQRIVVERHHGKIDIESKPGDTVVRVQIPVRPPPR